MKICQYIRIQMKKYATKGFILSRTFLVIIMVFSKRIQIFRVLFLKLVGQYIQHTVHTDFADGMR